MSFVDLNLEPEFYWALILGFIFAFVLAFGIGANDVANSFGTSVGSKVLSLRQACILACIFETLGAVLLGAKVSDTIRKGIIDVNPYVNDTMTLMVGNVAALAGACTWLIGATMLRLPVSATHSIVGATVGFALVAHGVKGINWTKFAMIIGSWFVSPVLAGLVSVGIFYICKFFILEKENPLEAGLRFLPVFYAITLVINLFSVFYQGPEILHFDKIPLYGTFILAFGGGAICGLIVWLIIVPWQRRRINALTKSGKGGFEKDPAEDAKLIGESPLNTANTSMDNSKDNSQSNSRRNSLDSQEKKPLDDSAPVIELELKTEVKENGGANNFLAPPNNNSINSAKINGDLKTPEKKSNLKKINKADDAPLMDNLYEIGNTTPGGPSRVATTDNIHKIGSANGEAVVIEVVKVDDSTCVVVKDDQETSGRRRIVDKPETAHLFSFLQILTATFGAFAHGGNDVSNAIGPLVSLWLIAKDGLVLEKQMTPPWILLYGGVGISIGLCVLGRRVIKTVGEDLTKITPSSGVCIEIGSALTVLVASNIGIPISTTHCKVGSVVCVGRFRSRENVDWKIFRNIMLAWLVTLPVAGGVSAAIMAGLSLTVPH